MIPRLTAAVVFVLLAAACSGSSESADPTASRAPTTDAPSTTTAPTTTAAPTTTTTTLPPIPEVTVAITGGEEVVFDYSESPCGTVARPDLSARAFAIDGTISLTLPHEVNHRMTGPDFDSLTVDCSPILTSTFDNDPAEHASHEWLAATYVEGSTVHAVIHNEFHGYESELADSQRDLLDFGDPPAWEFLARSANGSTSPMAKAAAGFSAGGLCSFDFWGGHPDVGCDAVARWTSDRDGEFVLDLRARKTSSEGDGVLVDVRVDGESVWEVTLTGRTSERTSLTVPVRTGSTIDLGVNALGSSSFDATELRMIITPDGVRCTQVAASCLLVELTAARSDDGGATFQRTGDPGDLVASPDGRYEHDVGLGARWQPSNIVAHPDGESHVMIVQLNESRGDNAEHSCLFRTTDLADPTAWRGWDGDDFTIAAIDAYASDASGPRCASIGPAPISGLVWSPELELFVASGGFGRFETNGHHLLFSPDLLRWSDPVLVKPAEFVFTSDSPPFEPYGTLIDHASTSPSFDTIGSTPYYYFTRINDQASLDFDLVRIPLEISLAE